VFRPPDRRIGHRSVRLQERRERDAGHRHPEVLRRFEIEAFVEVQPHAQPTLVDVEEPTKPGAEELDHPRVAVGQADLAIGLVAFAGVEGSTGDKQIAVAQFADPLAALGEQPRDLGLLGAGELVGPRFWAPWLRFMPARAARADSSKGTSRTQRLTELRATPSSATISA
jgi:hypothetical protein